MLRSGPVVREQVRWRDVDMMGVVYYGNYLRFMEAAEHEFFAALGLTYEQLASEHGVWVARTHLELDFHFPARLDDVVICHAELLHIGASSLKFAFPINREDGTHLADGALTLAALDRTTLRPSRLPAALRAALVDG